MSSNYKDTFIKIKIFLRDRYEGNFFNRLYTLNLVKVGTRTIQFNISRRIDVTSNKSWLPEDPVNRGLDAPAVTMHAAVYPFKDTVRRTSYSSNASRKRILISASRESPLYTRHATVSRKCLMLTVVRHIWASLKFACIICRLIKGTTASGSRYRDGNYDCRIDDSDLLLRFFDIFLYSRITTWNMSQQVLKINKRWCALS